MDWWKDTNKPDQEFLDRMSIEFEKIDKLFAEIPESTDPEVLKVIETKSKTAEGLIKHYLDLTKVLDQRRGDYYKAALQLVAIGLTGLGLLLKFITSSSISLVYLISISICLGLLTMIITAFRVITCFYWQTKSDRYHFLKIDTTKIPNLGNSWEWFYHGVEGLSKIPFISSAWQKSKKLEQDKIGVNGYIIGASFYFENFIKSTPRDLYIQNLKHAYLLLVHNAYKNKFERQLTDIMSKGVNTTFWVVIPAIIISILSGIFLSDIPFTTKDESTTPINMNISKNYTTPEEIKIDQKSQVKLDSTKKTDSVEITKTNNISGK
ncbi:Uncharacterised protein [Chryseobacterium nakagawai]|uniref:Uncharacterized protein n=1 Tax=Chryseobacterium nakagawai TaxID=1241982 RepID=A0AAD1DP63_CHRNA|nr:hypothetical protein [Chryseobacterium nakagawai]AZA90047.1 hypothetical protein EG343_05145 [Chryseobacterium nakagawai]VEH21489.1 Uncharacterised protein [Chryseobacterium nakagawai]